jgi:hypothetical protein
MATFELYQHQFDDNIKELAGSPNRSILKALVSQDNKQGAIAYLDYEKPGTAKGSTALSAKSTRKNYEADGSKTLAKFNAIFTPHDETVKQRTLIAPQLIEYGHNFDEDVDILHIVSPQNSTIKNLNRSVFTDEDNLIIAGISAANVGRVTSASANEITASTISLPGTQAITTENVGYISSDDIGKIRERMELAYADSKVYCLISPTDKRLMRKNDKNLSNTDFVGSSRYFETGELPDIDGVCFIPHPLITAGSFYAFTSESVVLNTFMSLRSDLSREGTMRFSHQAYIREKLDCKRVDDLLVVHGTVQS